MQIVIDLPEEDHKGICHLTNEQLPILPVEVAETLMRIANGTPIPKGHGKIMDVDKIVKKMEEREEQLKDNRALYETACVETAIDMFGETIIEADNKESEDRNAYSD